MALQHDTNNALFDGINIDEMEESLITVDVPESEAVAAAVKETQSDPPGGGESPPASGTEKQTEKPSGRTAEAGTIEVETETGDEAGGESDSEKETAKETKDSGGAPGDEDAYESPSYLHAAALQEEGVLPNLDLETLKGKEPAEVFKTINEHINTQIKESIDEGVTQYKSGFGERAQKLLEALDKGIPLDTVEDNLIAEERYGSIKDSDLADDEDLQKQVYSDLLAMKGFAPAKVTKMVDKALSDGDLEQEAKDGLIEIKQAISDNEKQMEAQAELDKKAQEKRNEEIKENVTKSVSELKEIIPGVTMSDKEKKAIIQNLTVPIRYENRNGRNVPVSRAMDIRSKDPLLYETRLNYFIEKGFFEKDAKFDEIVRKAETSASKKLIQKMGSEPRNSGKTTVKGSEGREEKDKPFIFPEF